MEGGKDQLPRPIVTFFQPRSAQESGRFFSQLAGIESAVQKFLPKSHISKVILCDNPSAQRMQEVVLRHLDTSQRKTCNYWEQVKKIFMHDQQNKMDRWKKQYSRYQRMLEMMDLQAMQGVPLSTRRQYSVPSSVQVPRKYSRVPQK